MLMLPRTNPAPIVHHWRHLPYTPPIYIQWKDPFDRCGKVADPFLTIEKGFVCVFPEDQPLLSEYQPIMFNMTASKICQTCQSWRRHRRLYKHLKICNQGHSIIIVNSSLQPPSLEALPHAHLTLTPPQEGSRPLPHAI